MPNPAVITSKDAWVQCDMETDDGGWTMIDHISRWAGRFISPSFIWNADYDFDEYLFKIGDSWHTAFCTGADC